MTHVQVTAAFSEELHPRADDGKFGSGSGGAGQAPRKAAKTTPRRRARRTVPSGQMGFDGVHGTGYGMQYGDTRVRALQEQLNRLGLTDSRGRKLRVDGELGPLTTQSIKAAQVRLGMKPTGVIDPAFINRLKATKAMPKPAKKAAPSKAKPDRVRAKFNPMQKRDPNGTWGDGISGAISDALKLADSIPLDDGETFEGSSRVKLPNADVRMALTRAADGSPSLRFGVAAELPGKWRGMNGGYTVKLDQQGIDELAAKTDELAATTKQAERDIGTMWSRIEERASEVGADPSLNRTPGEADFGDPELDRLVNEYDAFTDQVIDDGAIDSPWGQLYYRVVTTDEGAKTELLVTKPGAKLSGEDALEDLHGYGDSADFYPSEMRKLANALAKMRDAAGGSAVSAAQQVTAAELRGIELARPGKWNLASGPMEITDRHITDAARPAQRAGARPGYVKIGHTDKRFIAGDGEPALGWVENVRREVDAKGPKLVGDLLDMPEWFAAAARKHWPYRSIEGWADYTDPDTGEKYALVVDGVAVLGVTCPRPSALPLVPGRGSARLWLPPRWR